MLPVIFIHDGNLVEKPKQAEFLLNHPLIREFFEQLHRQVYSGLKKCKTDAAREELALYGRYADEFEQFFRAYLETGAMEDLQKREEQRRKEAEAERMEKIRSLYSW